MIRRHPEGEDERHQQVFDEYAPVSQFWQRNRNENPFSAGSTPVWSTIFTIEYLLMLLIQLGAEGFTTCRGAMDFSVSILRDTLGEELPYASDDMREGRNCQQKSRGTVR